MTDFKQIIGRGTRVRDDYGKLYFNILDYTGSATRLFADPDFDGEPALVSEEKMDESGKQIESTIIEEETLEGIEEAENPPTDPWMERGTEPPKKFYVDQGTVEIAAHLVYELDANGKQLRVVKFTDYTADNVRNMYPSAAVLRSKWSSADERAEIIKALEDRGISFERLAEVADQPEADPFDLLCHVAFNAPLRTRRERMEMLKRESSGFFDKYGPDAREVLDAMLEKYVEYGTAQFQIPEILKVPPLSERGTIPQIAALFGGAENMRSAVNEMQSRLYAS